MGGNTKNKQLPTDQIKTSDKIALLRLKKPLEFEPQFQKNPPKIRPICLPSSAADFEGERAILTGFGATKDEEFSEKLKELNLTVMSNTECQSKYKDSTETAQK